MKKIDRMDGEDTFKRRHLHQPPTYQGAPAGGWREEYEEIQVLTKNRLRKKKSKKFKKGELSWL